MKMLMIVSLLCAAANMVSAEDGITVRPSGVGGRIWQVSYAPDEPIKWPWVSGSVSARLTVVSYSGRTKTTVHEIEREEGYFGSYQLPAGDKEQLFDLTVDLLSSKDAVLETLSARVAVLPKKINVLVEGSDAWKTVRDRSPRPIAYDAAWKDPTAESTVFSMSQGGVKQDFPMTGISGFEPLDMAARLGTHDGEFSVALTFDEDDDVTFTADLRRVFPGLQLSIR
ncbi:MAG: hypothetical protein IKJ37_07610 [Kiritimatiellae bacterium]|nr:hypothetical protein [Kiritimatiellia bacterium]